MPTEDPYEGLPNSIEGTVSNALAVLPDDATDLPVIPLKVYFRTPGTYRVTFMNDQDCTLDILDLSANALQNIRIKRILDTGSDWLGKQDGGDPEIYLQW